eukprot:5382112-Amphidinium_carterae.1
MGDCCGCKDEEQEELSTKQYKSETEDLPPPLPNPKGRSRRSARSGERLLFSNPPQRHPRLSDGCVQLQASGGSLLLSELLALAGKAGRAQGTFYLSPNSRVKT